MWKASSTPKNEEKNEEPPIKLTEETDDSSHDENTSQVEEDFHDMPIMYYTRLFGSLPRKERKEGVSSPLSVKCTCSTMGKVLLTNETMVQTDDDSPARAQGDFWKNQTIFLAAYGFSDGRICIVDPASGVAIANSDDLKVREGTGRKDAIVALSFDATGTCFGAIDAGGNYAIFELKFGFCIRARNTVAPASTNTFMNLVSAFTAASRNNETSINSPLLPTLTASVVILDRFNYPKAFGTPTCLVMDPSFKRKREKIIAVGFADGRLILTKRGMFLRRDNKQIHQAIADNKYFRGIEAIAWRGQLLAWAESSGVRLIEAEGDARIAHVDRPVGARPSLYPTVVNLKPSLFFETSKDLLIAWGDSLVNLHIEELSLVASRALSDAQNATSTTNQRRRHVECTMAWKMDCIACGVAPIDAKHVAVLGLVPPMEGNVSTKNDLELQILSRSTGGIVYSDLLSLVTLNDSRRRSDPDSIIEFSLLSSYVVPRMEDRIELYDEGSVEDGGADDRSRVLSPDSAMTFQDPHIRWDLNKISYDHEGDHEAYANDEDHESVDSDDYGFIFRPVETDEDEPLKAPIPPIMTVVFTSDIVSVRMRDVDDAVSHALSLGKAALALKHGIRNARRLKRYELTDLVNEYLKAVLRIRPSGDLSRIDGDGNEKESQEAEHLSLRRLKLAAAALPTLLGADISLWNRWVSELEKIPGALFVVRNQLPVRDPILPEDLYFRVIVKMFEQTSELGISSSEGFQRLAIEAENHVLNTLLIWGTTNCLLEHIKLYRFQCELDRIFLPTLTFLEEGLRKRSDQTAAVYLHFPAQSVSENRNAQCSDSTEIDIIGHSNDSLYDINRLVDWIENRLEMVTQKDEASVRDHDGLTRISLDAKAKLDMMKGQFDNALRYFLEIGTLHTALSIKAIEDSAVMAISGRNMRQDEQSYAYSFVLQLIENHDLHGCLLDTKFLPSENTPLVSLMRLVGLPLVEDFLMKHCVAPQERQSSSLMTEPHHDSNIGRRGTLPLDAVAAQLESSPHLLHWYLHVTFTKKPELFVKFSNTTLPPPVITDLHWKLIRLYIEHAGTSRNSTRILASVEAYKASSVSTPLINFLKTILPLGAISPGDVKKLLDEERQKSDGYDSSETFALELAFILEQFEEQTEEQARTILDLYLKGTNSLMLAVSYVQRMKQYSSVLWEVLLDYCLSNTERTNQKDGALFGSLLEAAALSGADLANLVTQIPPGMAIEGLRPRLVAAVADYRLKLQMHQASSTIATTEKKDLLAEVAHRSRRGFRCDMVAQPTNRYAKQAPSSHSDVSVQVSLRKSIGKNRTLHHRRLSFSVPIR